MAEDLDINLLILRQKERNDSKKNVYKTVLGRVHQRIKYNSQYNQVQCFYEFPPVIIGSPLYDVEECMKYVKRKLIEKRLQVLPTNDTSTILISWEHLV